MSWFEEFADTIPEPRRVAEIEAIASFIPVPEFPRVLDVGCGVGRVTQLLQERGYSVFGIDISAAALNVARKRAPDAVLVALDQRDAAKMRWCFDAVLVLWNSLGFGSRRDDERLLGDLVRVLRPGGRLLLDLYHPEWLRRHEQRVPVQHRGTALQRWVADGRLFNRIRYADGHVDSMEFNVYAPREIRSMLNGAGCDVEAECVWWDPVRKPAEDQARYQMICSRPA